MTTLQIFGMGCAKCRTLTERTEAAAQALGLDYTVEKVTDLDAIVAAGVMVTPALVVDGQLTVAGRVPTVEGIKALLT